MFRKCFLIAAAVILLLPPQAAGRGWQEEFARLCGAVQEVNALAEHELRKLIVDCDELMAAIRQEEEDKNKVFLLRLEKCRNFYEYMATIRADSPH